MSFSVDRIRHLYDFNSHFLTRQGHRYHYLDEGDGEPVVMLHGNPSWSFMYRRLVRSLRGRYRTVVPDHLGCGLSDKPRQEEYGYQLEDRVSDLEYLLDSIGVKTNISMVVHDWGGPIGLSFATRHPERISRLIILNTTAFLLPNGKSLHWALRFARNWPTGSFLIRRFNAFARLAPRLGCRLNRMPAEVRRAYWGPYDSFENRVAVLRFVRDIPLSPTDPSYQLLHQTQEKLHLLEKVPTLICWGERDFVFDGDFLREWIRRFPGARVHRFPDAGHYLLEELPDQVIPRIQGFLRGDALPPW